MHNQVIPNVPVMVNTYYPPNAPSAMRCYKLGQAIRKAVADWDSDKTVATVGHSGKRMGLDSRCRAVGGRRGRGAV